MSSESESLLAPADEANLVLDHPGQVNVFLVAGVLSPGGFLGPDGTPDLAAVRAAVGERISHVPALRRVPERAGHRHRWADVQPDLDHHIRLTDPVEGISGLQSLCGRLMSVPLPLDRPLWALLLVPGASVKGIGMVLRIHHAIADGVSAVTIARHLFDGPVESAPVRARSPQEAAAPPRGSVPRLLGRLGFGARRIWMTVTGGAIGPTILLGERSERRGVVFLSADLAGLESSARSVGATVNDLLLAAATSGYRAALVTAGEAIPDVLPVSVPVALRRRGASRNQVGVMLVPLPLHVADPVERLRVISSHTRDQKIRAREQGTLELMRGPIGARIMDRLAARQHLVGGFITNVPGPASTLRLAGASVVAMWPVAVLAANVRLGVAAISYAGRLHCSVHFDADRVPGHEFARAVADDFAYWTSTRS